MSHAVIAVMVSRRAQFPNFISPKLAFVSAERLQLSRGASAPSAPVAVRRLLINGYPRYLDRFHHALSNRHGDDVRCLERLAKEQFFMLVNVKQYVVAPNSGPAKYLNDLDFTGTKLKRYRQHNALTCLR